MSSDINVLNEFNLALHEAGGMLSALSTTIWALQMFVIVWISDGPVNHDR